MPKKNIALTFLSDIKKDRNTGAVAQTPFDNVPGEPTCSTNESALRYLLDKLDGATLERIFVLASKRIREQKVDATDLQGREITHLEYFRERMEKFILDMDACMPPESVYPYDEDSPLEKSLESVAEVAELIQKMVAENPDDEIVLHVDLTGGMRSVNMMMLDIVRLIEYSDVKIGHLLYSKYNGKTGIVEELGDIYHLFQLIAGAEEFVSFGSAKAIKKYFAGKAQSPALTRLIAAMDNFAEELKLCHYGELKKAIDELREALDGFDKTENIQDTLMARLIGRIKADYHDLISRDFDDLAVIRWCLSKGYLQQALTLYTERVPEYLGEHGLIKQTAKEAKRLDDAAGKDSWKRNKWYYLLNVLSPKPNDKLLRAYFRLIKEDALNGMKNRDKEFDFVGWLKRTSDFFDKNRLQSNNMELLEKQINLLATLHRNPKLLLNLEQNKETLKPLRKIIGRISVHLRLAESEFARLKVLRKYVQNEATIEELSDIFPTFKLYDEMTVKYPNAARQYALMEEGTFSATIDKSDFLSLIDGYVQLKNERNHSNHALHGVGEFSDAESLRACMETQIAKINDAIRQANHA
ncbi:MAG: TM1812 family CRISPR-associated protein [Selenomonadaceae bacterium]|nr:TM1812 family CRISPR-associated protein [Selenomonadaceae bacterium]